MERDDGMDYRLEFTNPKMPTVLKCGDTLSAYCSIDHIRQGPYSTEPYNNANVTKIQMELYTLEQHSFEATWQEQSNRQFVSIGY